MCFYKDLEFTHLRIYSEYSIDQGMIKIDDIIIKAKKYNLKYIALTDKNNIFGSVEFYKKCKENKIKPIIGCEISIKNKYNNDFRILLLVKNNKGYENLSKLISKGNLYKDKFELDYILFKYFNEGLIIITGNENTDIGYFLKNNNLKLAKYYSNFWKKCFKNNIYFDLQYYNENFNFLNYKIIDLSNYLKIPIVFTHPVFFLNKEDFISYKIRISITKYKYKNIKNIKNFFFINKKNIKNILSLKNLNYFKNTIEISKTCNFFYNFNKLKLPFYKNLIIYNNNKYLIKKSLKGLKERFFLNKINFKDYEFYKNRLLEECKVIIKMGFSDYFLIVMNFLNWSFKKKLSYGPGRGSSSGSLVSYCLFITNIDPIKNSLLFERFLNIEKFSIPDFDIDFCKNDRKKIYKYIKFKFGLCNICNIITFGKLVSKASIRNVGKSLKFNYGFINNISKFFFLNKKIKKIIKENKYLKIKYKNDKKFNNLINLSMKMEGLIKSIGLHAAGIIITSNKIYNFFPILIQNELLISHYSKIDIEILGLLKFDFLILLTLTILSKILKIIRYKFLLNKNLYLDNININDINCYKMLFKENPIFIFQFESKGMFNMLLKAKPKKFKHIIALISLYRPGPINLINSFCYRKNNKKKIFYINKYIKDILKETYGIIIYQEQIMLIFKNIAGYSLNKADNLRKILMNKNKNIIDKEKKIFIKNSLNKIKKKDSIKIFNNIIKFLGYSFNKSHATSYALLSYYTMWLRKNYFLEFINVNMSFFFYDSEKIKIILNLFKKKNIFLLPININFSNNNFKFSSKKYNKIRYSFSSIKGLGYSVINEILNLRKKNIFKNFFDFFFRINKKNINYKSIEILISSGCFNIFDLNKSNLINILFYLKNNFEFVFYNKKYLINKKFFIKNKILKYFWFFKTDLIEEKLNLNYFKKNFLNFYKIKFFKILKKIKISFNNFRKFYKFGILLSINYKFIEKEKIFFIILINNNKEYNLNFNKKFFFKIKNLLKIFNPFLFKYNKKEKLIYNSKIYYNLKFIINFNLLISYNAKNKIKKKRN